MSSDPQRPPNAGPKTSQQFLPPPAHPSLRNAHSPPAAYATRRAHTTTPPPRAISPHPEPSTSASASALDVRTLQLEPTTPGTLEHEPSEVVADMEADVEEHVEAEEELSEGQLRELYDDEEIERFLRLFSAYVREARVAHPSGTAPQRSGDKQTSEPSERSQEVGDEDVELDISVETDEATEEAEPPPLPPRPDVDRSLSERIVMDYLLPLLPLEPKPPTFTVRRLYLTAERLYLAFVPAYEHLAQRLIRLAVWEDWNTSFFYCAAYWFLWYHNFLLPALVLRILYSLVRRKLLPYPNLQELREHRLYVERAKEFSATVTARLVAAPTYDVQDVWRLVHDFHRSRKLKKAARNNAKAETPLSDDVGDEPEAKPEEPPLPEEVVETEETDIKRELLAALSYIADLHERVKNIFLWRRPTSSLIYAVALCFTFLVTLLPAKYLSKSVGLALGIVFWHVVPILLAIPPSRRTKYPPLFQDVPTDAEYAMELISQRVARGLDVKPKTRRPKPGSPSQETDRMSMRTVDGDRSIQSFESSESSSSIKWQKWAGRVDTSKTVAKDAKKLFKDGRWKSPGNWTALNPLAAKVAMPDGALESRIQTYTFPAQYAMASGLITLTPDALFFTSLLSTTAKVAIPSDAIGGIKRTSPMRGLNVRWVRHHDDGQDEEREEKFLWVGDRDELFARLVAWGGHRWMNV
ncbi:uncharacterized protein B0H18DRAFT_1029023 [Fomitopsis serialis]|uniref:uncharacterized protein n=1 Tax=Fomitopsis serialis TaxID=139415 RepID=UPI00200744E6|nr:uncharacterized protein B0H18DRAFT_1029023 [Neoantrodia serialis]KAH9919070.1 hypothetical protein B0H18DRAFT_1029023 [Neoantrodia serialis]